MNRQYRILVVDDEEVFRSNLVRLLMAEGYHVGAAENGEEAIRAVKAEEFDVVILDLKMPGMQGEEVLPLIREYRSTAMVIVLTGHVTQDIGISMIEAGAFDYLIKPVAPRALLESVTLACEEGEILRDNASSQPAAPNQSQPAR